MPSGNSQDISYKTLPRIFYPFPSISDIYFNMIKLILGLLLAKSEFNLTSKLPKVNKIGARKIEKLGVKGAL